MIRAVSLSGRRCRATEVAVLFFCMYKRQMERVRAIVSEDGEDHRAHAYENGKILSENRSTHRRHNINIGTRTCKHGHDMGLSLTRTRHQRSPSSLRENVMSAFMLRLDHAQTIHRIF